MNWTQKRIRELVNPTTRSKALLSLKYMRLFYASSLIIIFLMAISLIMLDPSFPLGDTRIEWIAAFIAAFAFVLRLAHCDHQIDLGYLLDELEGSNEPK